MFRERGFRFHFFSNEGDPREAIHIHIAKEGLDDAKLWLYPEVAVAYNDGLDARTERWAIEIVTARRAEIESAWHEHFGTGN